MDGWPSVAFEFSYFVDGRGGEGEATPQGYRDYFLLSLECNFLFGSVNGDTLYESFPVNDIIV